MKPRNGPTSKTIDDLFGGPEMLRAARGAAREGARSTKALTQQTPIKTKRKAKKAA